MYGGIFKVVKNWSMSNHHQDGVHHFMDFLKPTRVIYLHLHSMVRICITSYFSVTNGTDVMTSDTQGFSCRNSFADCSLKKDLSIDQPMRERHSGSSANERNNHANISGSSCNLLRNWYTPDSKSVRQNPPTMFLLMSTSVSVSLPQKDGPGGKWARCNTTNGHVTTWTRSLSSQHKETIVLQKFYFLSTQHSMAVVRFYNIM